MLSYNRAIPFGKLNPSSHRAPSKSRVKPNQPVFPTSVIPVLSNPSLPLVVADQPRQAAKAAKLGFYCISCRARAYCWARPTDLNDKSDITWTLNSDFDDVALGNRIVFLIISSDETSYLSERFELARAMQTRGANVFFVQLSRPLDWFLASCGADAFRRVMSAALRSPSKTTGN